VTTLAEHILNVLGDGGIEVIRHACNWGGTGDALLVSAGEMAACRHDVRRG
jgi:hypothetical protein